jgi:hypothetical protein
VRRGFKATGGAAWIPREARLRGEMHFALQRLDRDANSSARTVKLDAPVE